MSRDVLSWAVLAAICFATGAARANPEPPALYDARSAGMGGTGLASVENATAAAHNPASLDGIENLSMTVAVAPLYPIMDVPFADPEGGDAIQYQNEPIAAPLFFVGAAGRVHDRVVLGLAAYAFSGIGASYDGVAFGVDADGDGVSDDRRLESMRLEAAMGEVTLPASIRINDELSVGAAVRLLYMLQRTNLYDPGDLSPLPAGRAEQFLDGFGFPGFMVGVRWAPTPSVRLAASYRSQVTLDLSGDTTLELGSGMNPSDPIAGLVDGRTLRTQSTWTVPRALRFGAAYALLEDRLNLTFELKLQFHRKANDVQRMHVYVPVGSSEVEQVQEVPLGWRDLVSLMTGGEYWVSARVPLRVGFGLGLSSTPSTAANPFMPPPGPTSLATVGSGYRFERFDLDFAFAYMHAGARVARATATGAAGNYEVHALQTSISLNYHN
ncbi:MAG: OmpP1/FadL family transporter [Myxococcota bacterium]